MIKLNNSEPLAEDAGKLLLRVIAGGVMFLQHGLPKLMNFGELSATFPDPIGLGPAISLGLIVLAEVVFALLVVAGIWTRLSTIPLIIGMGVIVFVTHGNAILGEGEMGLIYLMAFTAILLVGSGKFSLDRLFSRKPERAKDHQLAPQYAAHV